MLDLQYMVAEISNGSVGYVKIGFGLPLLLINGNSNTVCDWDRSFINALAKEFTIYLIDNRKTGESDSNNAESILGLAIDIKQFIEALGLENPLVLGFSMGGCVALELAKLEPMILRAVVLFSTSPNSTYINKLSEDFVEGDSRERYFKILFSESYTPAFNRQIRLNKLKIENYRMQLIDSKFYDRLLLAWHGFGKDDFQQIKLPVLILNAKNDMLIDSIGVGRYISLHVERVKLINYATGGHVILHKHALEAAADIINWAMYNVAAFDQDRN